MSSTEDFPIDDDDGFGYPSDLEDFGGDDGGDAWLRSSQDNNQYNFAFENEQQFSKAYFCLSPDLILKQQQEAIQTVNNILPNLPMSSVRVLLQRFHWDAMKLLNAFTERPEKICKEAGVPAPSQSVGVSSKGTEYCNICYEENELVSLPCSHAFCKDCWDRYLSIEVKERKQIILCCGKDCSMVMDEFTVLSLLKDIQLAKNFKEALMHSFVEDNPVCKWCPAPGCENAIQLLEASGEKNEVVKCDCSHIFCFRCLQADHRPCSCLMMQKWKKVHGGENTELDEGYVAAYSRPCPRCRVPIEKNFGCNHMTCKCGYHFCWTCMGKFGGGTSGGPDGYSTHTCNGTYEEDQETKDKKAELERYKHYSERYDTHSRSAKLEEKMLLSEDKILGNLKNEGFLGNDFSPAVQQILQNRNTLKHSYTFGYFRSTMAEYVNKGIFENLQLDLERHTEYLSSLTKTFEEEILKPNCSSKNIEIQRQGVVNQTRIAAKVLNALLDASSHWSQLITNEDDNSNSDMIDFNETEENDSSQTLTEQSSTSKSTKRAEKKSFYAKSLDKLREADNKKQKEEEEPKKKKKKKWGFGRKK